MRLDFCEEQKYVPLASFCFLEPAFVCTIHIKHIENKDWFKTFRQINPRNFLKEPADFLFVKIS